MTTATTAATITTETTLYHFNFHLYSTQKNNGSVCSKSDKNIKNLKRKQRGGQLERDVDNSPVSSAEVQEGWSYTSAPPIRLHGNFTFYLFSLLNNAVSNPSYKLQDQSLG
jgi:hypothetical protein